MTAFDQAFALLKMPYHGTNEESAKRILRHGTRAFRDKRPTFRGQPAQFWMASDPKEALRHARKMGVRPKNAGFADDDYRQSGFSRPVVLHISDEGVDSVPHNRRKAFGDVDYITHKHPHRIDPKHISVFDQGPKPNISPLFDWGDDYGVSLPPEKKKEGRESDMARRDEIDDYRMSVWNWRPDFDDRL